MSWLVKQGCKDIIEKIRGCTKTQFIFLREKFKKKIKGLFSYLRVLVKSEYFIQAPK